MSSRALMTSVELKLYQYARRCALTALVSHAGQYGRGWYHFSDGEVIVAREVSL